MRKLEEAEVLDIILEEMIAHQKRTKTNHYSSDFIDMYFHRLEKENDPLAQKVSIDRDKSKDLFNLIYYQDFNEKPIIKKNDLWQYKNSGEPYYNTREFLASGGFKELYKKENEELRKSENKQKYDYKIAQNKAHLSNRQKVTFWITFAMTVIAFLLSIYSVFIKK